MSTNILAVVQTSAEFRKVKELVQVQVKVAGTAILRDNKAIFMAYPTEDALIGMVAKSIDDKIDWRVVIEQFLDQLEAKMKEQKKGNGLQFFLFRNVGAFLANLLEAKDDMLARIGLELVVKNTLAKPEVAGPDWYLKAREIALSPQEPPAAPERP